MKVYVPDFPMPHNNVMITIYYMSWCPYSRRALESLQQFRDKKGSPLLYSAWDAEVLMENLLRKKKNKDTITPEELAHEGRPIFFQKLQKLIKDYRSFPLVFVKKEFIGGNSQLQELLSKIK